MNAPEDRFGLVIQDTLDRLTDRAFPGCPKADMPYSCCQLLANAAIAVSRVGS
jgi:hypothetical protein